MSTKLLPKLFFAVLAVPTLAVGAFVANLYITQESILFQGRTLPPQHEFQFAVPFEEVTIPVDGAELNGLLFKQPDPRGLVFFLHGNGGNLQSWTENVDYYQRVNYDMFMLDYRGYGKSTGAIESENQLHEDVRAAWDAIAPRYPNKPIVIYGRSLGAALAVKLAAEVETALVMLVSPFTSMIAMAQREYPYLPEWVVRYPMRTDQRIGALQVPLIIVHGDEDGFIPLDDSFRLKELAGENARLLVIEGAGHNNIHRFQTYLDGLTHALPD